MYTETTPNPLSLKFILGQPVVDQGHYLISSMEQTKGVVVLEEIMALPGISSIVLTPDFLSITKTSVVAWTLLESVLFSVLQHHLGDFPLSGEELLRHQQQAESKEFQDLENWQPQDAEEAKLFQDIESIVDELIRPGIQEDGGILNLCALKEGVLYVQLQGACSSCPHSQDTLKSGIENTLCHYFSEIKKVELI